MNPTHTTATLLLSAMISTMATAIETPDWTHTRVATDYLQMIPAANGGVIVMGEATSETDISDSDVYVARLDADGTVAWTHQWQGNLLGPGTHLDTDRFVDGVARPGGGVAVLGQYRDEDPLGNTSSRLNVTQVDAAGQIVSSTDLPWTSSSWGLSEIHVEMCQDGRIIVARTGYNDDPPGVLSLDADGQINWTINLNDLFVDTFVRVVDLVTSADGRTMICGEIQDFGNSQGMLAVSFSSDGQVEWSQIFDAPIVYGFQAGAAAVDAAGNLHVCADLVNLNFDSTLHVAKIDPSGTVLWEYNLDEPETNFFPTEIKIASNGNVYVGAHLYLPNGQSSFDGGFRVVGLDAAGTPLWSSANYVLPTMSSIQSTGLSVAPDGRIHVFGNGWLATQDSAQLIATWNADGTFKNLDVWNAASGHEMVHDACYDENDEFYACGQGPYVNGRYTGTIRHFPEAYCQGDVNQDGQVSIGDLLNLLAAFGSNDITADINDDGTVDIADLLVLLGNWDGCDA